MIPNTVLMAKLVEAQFTAPQLEEYGNIILNGYPYSYTGVNTPGAVGSIDALSIGSPGTGYTDGTYTRVYLSTSGGGNYGYADITVSGGNVTAVTLTSGGKRFAVGSQIPLGSLPGAGTGTPAYLTVTHVNQYGVRPAIKGWSTNYYEYYTQIPPNGYGVNPGDPTNFNYSVHSFTPATGNITALGTLQPGSGYTPGAYLNVPLISPRGTGATANITVNASGQVTSVVISSSGNGYAVGDGVTATSGLGGGKGFTMFVTAITQTSPAGLPRWAQSPRFQIENNGYALYPVADRQDPPPIDYL